MRTTTINLTNAMQTSSVPKKKKKKDREGKPLVKKKKLVTKEEKKVKKKKKKEGKSLMTQEEVLRDSLTKEERRKMKKIEKRLSKLKSTYKDCVPGAFKLISDDNLPMAMASMSKGLLMMLNELIPIAEAEYRKRPGQSPAYAMNALISQSREVQADIRADNDSGALGQRIVEEIIRINMHALGQQFASSLFRIREAIRPLVKESNSGTFEQAFISNADEVGKYCDQIIQKIADQVYAITTLE